VRSLILFPPNHLTNRCFYPSLHPQLPAPRLRSVSSSFVFFSFVLILSFSAAARVVSPPLPPSYVPPAVVDSTSPFPQALILRGLSRKVLTRGNFGLLSSFFSLKLSLNTPSPAPSFSLPCPCADRSDSEAVYLFSFLMMTLEIFFSGNISSPHSLPPSNDTLLRFRRLFVSST